MDQQPEQTPTPAPAPAPLPPQQPPAPGVSAPTEAKKGLAVTALVLGIIAFLFGWMGLLSFLGIGNLFTALAAVIFGIIALSKKQSKGMALTGTILGGFALITTVLLMILSTIGVMSSIQNQASDSSSSTTTTDSSSTTSSWSASAAYDKVETGMTKAEVEAAVGKTSESCTVSSDSYGKFETCSYGDYITDGGSLSVSYTDDKVSSKSKYGDS